MFATCGGKTLIRMMQQQLRRPITAAFDCLLMGGDNVLRQTCVNRTDALRMIAWRMVSVKKTIRYLFHDILIKFSDYFHNIIGKRFRLFLKKKIFIEKCLFWIYFISKCSLQKDLISNYSSEHFHNILIKLRDYFHNIIYEFIVFYLWVLVINTIDNISHLREPRRVERSCK